MPFDGKERRPGLRKSSRPTVHIKGSRRVWETVSRGRRVTRREARTAGSKEKGGTVPSTLR